VAVSALLVPAGSNRAQVAGILGDAVIDALAARLRRHLRFESVRSRRHETCGCFRTRAFHRQAPGMTAGSLRATTYRALPAGRLPAAAAAWSDRSRGTARSPGAAERV